MSGHTAQPPPGGDGGHTLEHRYALGAFRSSLDGVLEWFAIVQTLPTRRADDQALRDAIDQAKPPIAAILAVLDRMEPPGGWTGPTDALADDAGLALVDQTFTPDEGEQAREQAEEEREADEQKGA